MNRKRPATAIKGQIAEPPAHPARPGTLAPGQLPAAWPDQARPRNPDQEPLVISGQGTTIPDDPAGQPPEKKELARRLRYPLLLGPTWRLLPPQLQSRFTGYKPPRQQIIYQGRVHETRHSFAGRCLTKLAAFIGSPLPFSLSARGPATVIVREAADFNGQYWTRVYPTSKGTPQVIHSVKKFAGPTGLMEMISPHIAVCLKLKASRQALTFTSAGYLLVFGRWHLPLPNWLSPGRLTVIHRQTGLRKFRFTLALTHPLFGDLVYQTGIFEEITP